MIDIETKQLLESIALSLIRIADALDELSVNRYSDECISWRDEARTNDDEVMDRISRLEQRIREDVIGG